VLTQTRRHSCLAHLVGIPHLLVAVNKMDLVGYDRAVFERIRLEYLDFAQQLGISWLHGAHRVWRGCRR
jgi:sulfate adenylyltransferase subunit 1